MEPDTNVITLTDEEYNEAYGALCELRNLWAARMDECHSGADLAAREVFNRYDAITKKFSEAQ